MKKNGVSHLKIKDIMTANVYCVNPALSVKEVIVEFLNKKISGAPVIHITSGYLISVVSEADLMKFAAAGDLNQPLLLNLDKMPNQKDLITVHPEEPFVSAFKKFLTKPVRRVIVIDEQNKPVGIVSRRDIIKSFIEHEHDLEKQ